MKKLFYIFLILICASLAHAENFCVDQGDNWNTFACASDCAAEIAANTCMDIEDIDTSTNWAAVDTANKIDAGDTVYFSDAGGNLAGSVRVHANGTSGEYITLINYPGDSPVIVADTFQGIGLNDDYIVIDGLKVISATTAGINIGDGSSYIYIQNCTIGDVADANLNGISINGGDYIWVQDNIIHENQQHGILIASSDPEESTYITIRRNDIHDNCEVTATDYIAGIKLIDNLTDHVVIEYNDIYSNGTGQGGTQRGVGIHDDTTQDLDGGATIIRYNLIHDNNSIGQLTEDTSYTETYGNIGWDNAEANFYLAGGAGGTTGNKIYNNSSYSSSTHGFVLAGNNAGGSCTSIDFKNNISLGNTTYAISIRDDCEGNVTISHNSFGTEAENWINWDGAEKSTYDAFEISYGSTTNSIESDCMNDPASDDFTLVAGDSCINTGTIPTGFESIFPLNPLLTVISPYSLVVSPEDYGTGREIGAFSYPHPQTFYIDSTCTDTNPASATIDGNTYDPDTPACTGGSSSYYVTVADINAAAATLVPGDTISFRKGQIWREALTWPETGTSGAYYNVDSHGSGDLPIISGGDDITTGDYQWTCSAARGGGGDCSIAPKVYYLEASGGGNPSLSQPYSGLLDRAHITQEDTAGALSDHGWAWDDDDTLGFSTVYFRDDTGDPDVSGVQVEVAQRETVFDLNGLDYINISNIRAEMSNGNNGAFDATGAATYITFTGVEGYFSRQAGLHVNSGAASVNVHVTVTDSDFGYNNGNQVVVQTSVGNYVISGFTMTGTELHHGWRSTDFAWGYGFTAFRMGSSTIGPDNYSHDNRDVGIKLDGSAANGGCDSNTITKNRVIDNGDSGIVVEKLSDSNIVSYNFVKGNSNVASNCSGIKVATFSINNQILYNILINQHANAWSAIAVTGSDAEGASTGTLIYNNSIYESNQNQGIAVKDGGSEGTLNGIKIKNNIIMTADAAQTWCLVIGPSDDWTDFESDYNILERVNQTNLVYYDNSTNKTLAQWQATNLYGTYYPDLSSQNVDPLYNTPGSDDLTLQSDSPAIDKGLGIAGFNSKLLPGSTWPSGVITGPVGNNNDIGAYEYPVWGE